MNTIRLKNNLQLMYHFMPNVHSVSVGLYIRAGSAYETPENNGITHFIEHLHFRRSAYMKMDELYYRMESIGSTLTATTYRDCLKFNMKVHPDYINECIEIFKSIIDGFEWSCEDVEAERRVVLDQLYAKSDYPYAESVCDRLVFCRSALEQSIIGTEENILNMTCDQLNDYRKSIMCAENMMLCITGCVNGQQFESIKGSLEKLDVQSGNYNKISFIPVNAFHRKYSYKAINTPDKRIDVHMAFDVDPDLVSSDVLYLINCILGEGVGSRLQRTLREKEGITSDIYSYILEYENFCVLNISYSVDKVYLLKSISLINSVLYDMKTSVNKYDLDVSLPFHTKNKAFDEDDSLQMNNNLGFVNFILNRKYGKINLENDENTISLLKDAAQKIFKTNNLSIALVGNMNRIPRKSIYEMLHNLR